jgi:hypothetical protein
MNKHRYFITKILVFLLPVSGVFSVQTNLGELEKNAKNFNAEITHNLPLYAGLGLNWSDAYIGQLLSVHPHFGLGVSMGFSASNFGSYKALMNSFNLNTTGFDALAIPAALLELRLGGLVLPFDMGFKIGKFNNISTGMLIPSDNFNRDILFFGTDIRAALSKGAGLPPKISLGFGYNYFSGVFTNHMKNGLNEFLIDGGEKLFANDPDLSLYWEISSLDLKLQISKTLLVFTPYLGAAASFYWARTGYKLEGAPLNYTGSWQTINDAFYSAGISGITIDPAKSFSSEITGNNFSTRVFGGFSFNIFLFKLDLTMYCGFPDYNIGGSLGFRIQT